MVGLKLVLLAFVVLLGFYLIFSKGMENNWKPFLPKGMKGVLKGVSAVFFAYIGFDAISTTAEECANPRRDMPRGMLYSLLICTVVYILVALVITGLVNYKEFEGVADPLAYVFNKINMQKIGLIIAVSAVIASTSVLLVFQIGQPRIWMSMSRDGLLPKPFAQVSKRYKTPAFATIITGFLVGIPTLFIDDNLMTDLTSIGTLFAFVLVCCGVLLLPRLKKEKDKFQLPYINGKWLIPALSCIFLYFFRHRLYGAFGNLGTENYEEILFIIFVMAMAVTAVLSFLKNYSSIPILGMLCCLYLMISIPPKSWLVFFGWMCVGLLIYFAYGYRKSKLGLINSPKKKK
jgi:amino acid transporter